MQIAVQRIRELRRKRPGERRTGYRKIGQTLQAEGFPTQQGGDWTPSTVRSIINGPVYKALGKQGQTAADPEA